MQVVLFKLLALYWCAVSTRWSDHTQSCFDVTFQCIPYD